jgi:hypothetical protein
MSTKDEEIQLPVVMLIAEMDLVRCTEMLRYTQHDKTLSNYCTLATEIVPACHPERQRRISFTVRMTTPNSIDTYFTNPQFKIEKTYPSSAHLCYNSLSCNNLFTTRENTWHGDSIHSSHNEASSNLCRCRFIAHIADLSALVLSSQHIICQ